MAQELIGDHAVKKLALSTKANRRRLFSFFLPVGLQRLGFTVVMMMMTGTTIPQK